MYYVGLDVHYRTSTYCILNAHGRELKCETVRGHWTKLLERLATIKGKWTICFEATCGYGYLHRELSRMASRVIVAHPGQLRLIFRSKRKNDRVDSRKLAKLLYLDEVPPVYVPGEDVQSWRELIEHRRRVVDRQTACKNAIRSLLRGHGIIAPKGLWTKKGLAWLGQAHMPTPASALKRDMLLDELADVNRGVRTVAKALDKIGLRHAGVNRLGHITRQGPGTARKYLVEAAWQGVYRSPKIRAYFERILRGKKERRKIALVATAHYLLRCMHAMLVRCEP